MVIITLPYLCATAAAAHELTAAAGTVAGTVVEIRARRAAVVSDSFLEGLFADLHAVGASGYWIRGLRYDHRVRARAILTRMGVCANAGFANVDLDPIGARASRA